MTDMQRFEPFLKELASLKQIDTPTAYKAAAEALLQVKKALKTIEDKKQAITAPARKAAQEAAALFSKTEKGLSEAEDHLKAVLSSYIDRRVPEAAAQAGQALSDGNREALAASLTAVPHVDGLKLSTETDFDVVDFDAIPDAFLKTAVDRKLLLDALRRGQDVPGVKVIERTRISVSVKE
jgi:hypothetical protein